MTSSSSKQLTSLQESAQLWKLDFQFNNTAFETTRYSWSSRCPPNSLYVDQEVWGTTISAPQFYYTWTEREMLFLCSAVILERTLKQCDCVRGRRTAAPRCSPASRRTRAWRRTPTGARGRRVGGPDGGPLELTSVSLSLLIEKFCKFYIGSQQIIDCLNRSAYELRIERSGQDLK